MIFSFIAVVFKSEEAKTAFVNIYKVEADFVKHHEQNTLSYELAISDANPLEGILIERFTDKDAYFAHKKADVFVKFRKELQALQDEGSVSMRGQSYIDSNLGFV